MIWVLVAQLSWHQNPEKNRHDAIAQLLHDFDFITCQYYFSPRDNNNPSMKILVLQQRPPSASSQYNDEGFVDKFGWTERGSSVDSVWPPMSEFNCCNSQKASCRVCGRVENSRITGTGYLTIHPFALTLRGPSGGHCVGL